MPRYFFNVSDGSRTPDLEGVELRDLGAAKLEAAHLFAQIVRDDGARVWSSGAISVYVENQAGDVLAMLSFTAVEPLSRRMPGASESPP